MLKLLLFSLTQSLFLAAGQVSLKFAVVRLEKFSWSWSFFKSFLLNWPLLFSGIEMGIACILWLYMLKHWPFSIVYPLSSMAYLWGMIAAALLLHEPIMVSRWIGVVLIVAGSFLVIK